MQKILVIALLVCAVLVLLRRFRRVFGRRASGSADSGSCGGGCGCRSDIASDRHP